MLEHKDLEMIRQVIRAENEEQRARTESFLLDEMGRVYGDLENHIQEVKKNLEELNQYYRITKLENDNTAILLQMMSGLSKRVEELEKKAS